MRWIPLWWTSRSLFRTFLEELFFIHDDWSFEWCRPTVAYIRWDYRLVRRRVVRWANNVAHGKEDRRQSFTKAEFVAGGTVGALKV